MQDTSEEDLSQVDERELDAEFAGEFLCNIIFIFLSLASLASRHCLTLALASLLVEILFPRYLCYMLMHFCQTFVNNAAGTNI